MTDLQDQQGGVEGGALATGLDHSFCARRRARTAVRASSSGRADQGELIPIDRRPCSPARRLHGPKGQPKSLLPARSVRRYTPAREQSWRQLRLAVSRPRMVRQDGGAGAHLHHPHRRPDRDVRMASHDHRQLPRRPSGAAAGGLPPQSRHRAVRRRSESGAEITARACSPSAT